MNLQEFAAFHLPALAADEIRFNVQIAIITTAAAESPADFSYWTLGAAGQCATRSAGHAILLGNLNRTQCEELAYAVSALAYPGVVGAGETAHWFDGKARQLGAKFHDAIPQCIYFLPEAPRCPAADGFARETTAADSALLFAWMSAFHKEAVPHDPPPEQNKIDNLAAAAAAFSG